jgi:hypothetical protein
VADDVTELAFDQEERPTLYDARAQQSSNYVSERWNALQNYIGLDDSPNVDAVTALRLAKDRKITIPPKGLTENQLNERIERHDADLVYDTLKTEYGMGDQSAAFLMGMAIELADPTILLGLGAGKAIGIAAKMSTKTAALWAKGVNGLEATIAAKAGTGALGRTATAAAKGSMSELPYALVIDPALEHERGVDYTAAHFAGQLVAGGALNAALLPVGRAVGGKLRTRRMDRFNASTDEAVRLFDSGDIDGDEFAEAFLSHTLDVQPNLTARLGDIDAGRAVRDAETRGVLDKLQGAIEKTGGSNSPLAKLVRDLQAFEEFIPRMHADFTRALSEDNFMKDAVDEFIATEAVAQGKNPQEAVAAFRQMRDKIQEVHGGDASLEKISDGKTRRKEGATGRVAGVEEGLAKQELRSNGKALHEDRFTDDFGLGGLPEPEIDGVKFKGSDPIMRGLRVISDNVDRELSEDTITKIADGLHKNGVGAGSKSAATRAAIRETAGTVAKSADQLAVAQKLGGDVGARTKDGYQYGMASDLDLLDETIERHLANEAYERPARELTDQDAAYESTGTKADAYDANVVESHDLTAARERLAAESTGEEGDIAADALRRDKMIEEMVEESLRTCQITQK